MINSYLNYIQENYKSNEITLGKFNKSYYNSLKDKNKIYFDEKAGKYFVIKYNNENCGIVGVIIRKPRYFFQIILEPKFRGKNFVEISANLIMDKFKLNKLYAAIINTNTASLKAHKKSGFKRNLKKEKELKNQKKLIDKQILLNKIRR